MNLIVIDANVWIRFARSKNISPIALRLYKYKFVPVTNQYLFSEIFDALTDNKWMTEKQATQLLSLLSQICYHVTERVVYRISPDAKDNYLFDLAIQNNCAFIISDDNKLLSFRLPPVKVKSTNWFLKNFPL
jgi:putative PIN family toxin of toxin-antitoxin system